MKNITRQFSWFSILFWVLALVTVAQAADTVVNLDTGQIETSNIITTFVLQFAQSHPWLMTILSLIGAFRAVAKPLTTWYEARVKATPDTADDIQLENVQHSIFYKALCWLLDFGASVKVGPQKTPTIPPTT